MTITIDTSSSVPLEEQLRNQLRELIAMGKLPPGYGLPSTRQLAADLAIHFNTVARAYRRLQSEGLLAIGRGRGVFVKAAPQQKKKAPRATREELTLRLRQILVDAHLIGLSTGQTQELVLAELESFSKKEKRG